MRFLVWNVGCLVIALGLAVSKAVAPSDRWLWWLFLILWLLLAFGLGVTGIVRLVVGKMKAGALAVPPKGMTNAPASKVEE